MEKEAIRKKSLKSLLNRVDNEKTFEEHCNREKVTDSTKTC